MNKQTEALKMAIEHILEYEWRIDSTDTPVVLQACKEALEQPAQEPVAWTRSGDLINLEYHKSQPDGGDYCIDLVCMVEKYDDFDVALYAHPAPSWQGLSDDEIEDIWGEPVEVMYSGHYDGIRAIEAKLKEKNYGKGS